jgi:hypothetical protein
MTQEHSLQSQLQQALLMDSSLEPALLNARGVAQFGIYFTAYRARLRAALRDNFETLPLVMSDEAIDALANGSVECHPSQHYSPAGFALGRRAHLARTEIRAGRSRTTQNGLTALQAPATLAARLFVAAVFFRSGLTKIADWETTLALLPTSTMCRYYLPRWRLLPAPLVGCPFLCCWCLVVAQLHTLDRTR